MNWREELTGEGTKMDLELEQSLKHFKASMDAWSDAASTRKAWPRTMAATTARRSWQLAMGWALGCLVAMSSLAVGAHAIYQRQQAARIAAEKNAQKTQQERAAAARVTPQPANVTPVSAQQNKKAQTATTRKVSAVTDSADAEDEDLLAAVDSDVSRGVPAAMEPLAQLMDDGGTQ